MCISSASSVDKTCTGEEILPPWTGHVGKGFAGSEINAGFGLVKNIDWFDELEWPVCSEVELEFEGVQLPEHRVLERLGDGSGERKLPVSDIFLHLHNHTYRCG